MSFAKDYAKKLLDGRWQKKRLEILQRDGFCCTICQRQHNVQIHHNWYLKNMEPWDYNGDQLVTLCNEHHEEIGELQEGLKRLLARSGPEIQRKVYDYLYGLLNETKETFIEQCLELKLVVIKTQRVDPYLYINFRILSGENTGKIAEIGFPLWSGTESEATGKANFSSLCRAVDVPQPRHSDELLGKECLLSIFDSSGRWFFGKA